jgi:hypothetical protein
VSKSVVQVGIAAGVAGLAALGGALSVFSGYDDAPGGVLLGWAMILAAVVLGAKAQVAAGRRGA